MRLAILPAILASAIPSTMIKEYALQNYDTITQQHNLIGQGCSSRVYGFGLLGESFALKEYYDPRRCRREVAFHRQISCLNLPVVPKVYFGDVLESITVMDKLNETLGVYLDRNAKNHDALKRVVNSLFDGLTVLHEKEIVHGNIHLDNIMVHKDALFFIDFDESFLSSDFTLDLLRLRHKVLSEIEGWEGLVDRDALRNPESFKVLEEIYKDPWVSRVFRAANFFNAPAVQYWVYRLLSLPTDLRSLVSKYSSKIKKD